MAINFNDNILNRSPKDQNDKTGVFEAGQWRPWNTINEALTSPKLIPAYRNRGLTIYVLKNGQLTEYWFRDGINDIHLIQKTNDIVENVFSNGIKKNGNQVKLGLDLLDSTFTNGLLTEDTILVRGNLLASEFTAISINEHGLLNSVNGASGVTIATGLTDNPTQKSLESKIQFNSNLSRFYTFHNTTNKSLNTFVTNQIANTRQSLEFLALEAPNMANSTMLVVDELTQRGLEYAADYRANFRANSLITKAYVDALVAAGGNLQSVTNGTGNNITTNAIILQGIGGADFSKDGLHILHAPDGSTAGLIKTSGGAPKNALSFDPNRSQLLYQGTSISSLDLRTETTSTSGAIFNSRVGINDAINNNEATTLGQVLNLVGSGTPTLKQVTDKGNFTDISLQVTGNANLDPSKNGFVITDTTAGVFNSSSLIGGMVITPNAYLQLSYNGPSSASRLFLREEDPTLSGAQFSSRVSGLNGINPGDFITMNQLEANNVAFIRKLGDDVKTGDLTINGSLYAHTDSTVIAGKIELTNKKVVGATTNLIGLTIDNNLTVTDDISNLGLVYQKDFSTNGILNNRWIPDWGAVQTRLLSYQALSAKGNPNGYASLDSTGKIPQSQLNYFTLEQVTSAGNTTTQTITINPDGNGKSVTFGTQEDGDNATFGIRHTSNVSTIADITFTGLGSTVFKNPFAATGYTPTVNQSLATKKYVDDTVGAGTLQAVTDKGRVTTNQMTVRRVSGGVNQTIIQAGQIIMNADYAENFNLKPPTTLNPGVDVTQTFQNISGTIALLSDVNGKANLVGTNNFTGRQNIDGQVTFKNFGYTIDVAAGAVAIVQDGTTNGAELSPGVLGLSNNHTPTVGTALLKVTNLTSQKTFQFPDIATTGDTLAVRSDIQAYADSLIGIDNTSTPFTTATLNSTYGSKPIRFKLVCPNLGITYEKFNTSQWFSTNISVLP